MIYEAYEKRYGAISYPSTKEYKDKRWAEFSAKPQPTMSMALSHANLKELIKNREAEHHEQVKVELEKLRTDYRNACEKVNASFRIALANEYLREPEHKKEPELWRQAWERGHANGYSDVEAEYSQLCDLIN